MLLGNCATTCCTNHVCAAETRDKQKQGLVLREILLPNRSQRQQDFATPPMLLGYARVSKADDQDTAAQVSALKAAGCTRVYEETASGGRWDRPELHGSSEIGGAVFRQLCKYNVQPCFGMALTADTPNLSTLPIKKTTSVGS